MLFAGVEQIVLHRCPVSACVLVEAVPVGSLPVCTPPGELCGAPVLPDQAPRPGHAWVFCGFCGTSVGICGAESVADLTLEAAAIVADRWR